VATQHKTIDDFLDAQSPAVRVEVNRLRATIMDAEPRLVEIVKWNSPTFTLDGEDRLTINASLKGSVRLILHRGTSVAETKGAASTFDGDPQGLLTWHSDIRASLPAEADAEAAASIVRAWLQN